MSKARAGAKNGNRARMAAAAAEETVEYTDRSGTTTLPSLMASYKILHLELARLTKRIDEVLQTGEDEQGWLNPVQEERARAALRSLQAMETLSPCNQTLLAYRFTGDKAARARKR